MLMPFSKNVAHPTEELLMDRLLTAGIVEARGCERLLMVAKKLETQDEQLSKVLRRTGEGGIAASRVILTDLPDSYFPMTQFSFGAAELPGFRGTAGRESAPSTRCALGHSCLSAIVHSRRCSMPSLSRGRQTEAAKKYLLHWAERESVAIACLSR